MSDIPFDPRHLPFIDGLPQGIKHLHTAATVPEAELLTQVLTEAGFHIEYVPTTGTGVFGLTGNNAIYVREDEYDAAAEFLRDYLNSI